MEKKFIIELQDAFYSLTNQIDYGDISNMDIYWDGISSAIEALPIKELRSCSDTDVVSLLKSLPPKLVPDNLVDIMKEMTESTDKSSDDTFRPDDLRALRMLAEQAEPLFEIFVENLTECHDE